nr:hypothetical protein GCM10020092_101940 [Actinoplanes digitatis]
MTLRLISLVVTVCSSTADAMVVWYSLIRPMIPLISSIASTAPLRVGLDGGDPLTDVLGRPGGLLCQVLDLAGHHGETLAHLAGPGGLDGGVEG